MTWNLLVQPQPGPPPAPHAPAPLLLFVATVALVLMMLRRHLHLQAQERRFRMTSSPENPGSGPSDGLPTEGVDHLEANLPLAVFLVGGDHPLGPPSLRIFGNLYGKEYPQVLFVSIGVLDYRVIESGAEGKGTFKGTEEPKILKKRTRISLDPYLAGAHKLGLKADCRVSVATSTVDGIDALSEEIAAIYPRAVYFVSKLVFQKPRWYHALLHAGTSDAIRKRLEKKGFPVTVIPVVI